VSAFFDTVAEYDAEIALARTALRRALTIGQDHSNSSGGSSRSTEEVDPKFTKGYLKELIEGKADLCGTTGMNRGRGW